jgi:hypothetical protein
MKTVEEFFSTFKEEGNIWPKGLLVRLRDGSFEKVFAVMPDESLSSPEKINTQVIGFINCDCSPDAWSLNGYSFDGDPSHRPEKDIVEIYSGELIAKTKDEDEQKEESHDA